MGESASPFVFCNMVIPQAPDDTHVPECAVNTGPLSHNPSVQARSLTRQSLNLVIGVLGVSYDVS